MDLLLKNKNIVIIGGSRGIGLSITKGFLKEGAMVHVVSRKKFELSKYSNFVVYIASRPPNNTKVFTVYKIKLSKVKP